VAGHNSDETRCSHLAIQGDAPRLHSSCASRLAHPRWQGGTFKSWNDHGPKFYRQKWQACETFCRVTCAGVQAIIRTTAIDKWTGSNKTFTLEDGDTIEECLQPGQGLLNGALIEPVLDDAEYSLSALKVDVKGAVMSLFQ